MAAGDSLVVRSKKKKPHVFVFEKLLKSLKLFVQLIQPIKERRSQILPVRFSEKSLFMFVTTNNERFGEIHART